MPTEHPQMVIIIMRLGDTFEHLSFFFPGPWGRTRGTVLSPPPPRRGVAFSAPNLGLVWVEDRRKGSGRCRPPPSWSGALMAEGSPHSRKTVIKAQRRKGSAQVQPGWVWADWAGLGCRYQAFLPSPHRLQALRTEKTRPGLRSLEFGEGEREGRGALSHQQPARAVLSTPASNGLHSASC